MVFVSALWHRRTPWRHCDSAGFGRCRSPVLQKSDILGARYKPWEQLHYLLFLCSAIGSPSWSLFLGYDIDTCPNATTNSAGFRCCRSPILWKSTILGACGSRRNKSNVYVSPLAHCATIMAFLTILHQIVFTKIFPPCNMNSHEGGLREGAGQPRHEWVVLNNNDRLWFNRYFCLRSSQRLGLAEMRVPSSPQRRHGEPPSYQEHVPQ